MYFSNGYIVYVISYLCLSIHRYTLYLCSRLSFEGFLVSSLLDTKTYRGWIPFYNKYLLGNITGDHVLGIISSLCAFPVLIIGYVLFAMDELNYLLFVVFLVILIIGFIVDRIIAYHFLSKRCKYASWLIVLSVFSCGFLRPIILFITKDYIHVSKS